MIFINANVTADGDYQLGKVVNAPPRASRWANTTIKLWGVPAAKVHDTERVIKGGFSPNPESPVASEGPLLPLMSNPTSCTGAPLWTGVEAESWQEPGAVSTNGFDHEDGTPITIGNCGEVPFVPSLSVQPTSKEAGSPTGLDATLSVQQSQDPEGLSAAHRHGTPSSGSGRDDDQRRRGPAVSVPVRRTRSASAPTLSRPVPTTRRSAP